MVDIKVRLQVGVIAIMIAMVLSCETVTACWNPPPPKCTQPCHYWSPSQQKCIDECPCPCAGCIPGVGCYEDCDWEHGWHCCCSADNSRGQCYKPDEHSCCDGRLCDLDECETCVDGVCEDRCTYYYADWCMICDGAGYCIDRCDPDEHCCDGTCCPNHKCCVDGDCIKGGCRPRFDLEISGECSCYEENCTGFVTQTFIWYCEEYDGGCPSGTECKQTGTELCYTSRTAACGGSCPGGDPSECALSDWSYAPKALRCLCGCCP